MSDTKNQFTVDTYFIITVVAGVLYIIIRKFWDNWRNTKRVKQHATHLNNISEKITNVLEGINSVRSRDLSEIKMLVENQSKHIQSISKELEPDLECPPAPLYSNSPPF